MMIPCDMTDAQLQDEIVRALAAEDGDPAVLDALEDEAEQRAEPLLA